MAISTNQKPTIYRNLYDNTASDLTDLSKHKVQWVLTCFIIIYLNKLYAVEFEEPIRSYLPHTTECTHDS